MPYDARRAEEERWIGDEDGGRAGRARSAGLYVPEEYGGQGPSQTGYRRVSEVFAQIDPALSVVMGVHQSIGMKGIVMFGNDEQKARLLPDLDERAQPAGFALTGTWRPAGRQGHAHARRARPTAPGASTA